MLFSQKLFDRVECCESNLISFLERTRNGFFRLKGIILNAQKHMGREREQTLKTHTHTKKDSLPYQFRARLMCVALKRTETL